ncbi:patatin-like phospholipase family protein [Streptomyces umbrinus]|uniref:patatin-like phospholipase family protein n=1 Tax=Streptomyces umbrinus TaxID=67370 RepID=UPI003C2B5FB5
MAERSSYAMTEAGGEVRPRKVNLPADVQYLALEGGGGKGVVYLGAIRALEEMGVLPLPVDKQAREVLEEMEVLREQPPHQVIGVSGASAGAFTALFLALGFDSSELAVILSNPSTFKALYDGPDNNEIRAVHENRFRRAKVFDNPIDAARRRKAELAAEQEHGRRVSIRPIPLGQRAPRVHDFPFADDDFSVGTSAGLVGTVAAASFLGSPFLTGESPVDQLGPYVDRVLESPLGLAEDLVDRVLESPLELAEDLSGLAALVLLVKSLSPGITGAISEWLRAYIRGSLAALVERKPWYGDLVKQVASSDAQLEQYLYNLLFDRGVFPGFAVRDFLKDRVVTFLRKRNEASEPGELSRLADELTFAGLKERTGTKLVVAAVNITTHEPAFFGPDATPDFPVVDAVAISGCIPPAFKPVLVTGCDRVPDGFWMDGGIANNLPMHAFDDRVDGPLQPGLLALRLEELGDLSERSKLQDPAVGAQVIEEGMFTLLADHLSDLAVTAMFTSESGQVRRTAPQLRTAEVNEASQTILLNTHRLDTLEFAPPFEHSGPRIEEAFMAVVNYFNRSGSRYTGAIADYLEELQALSPSSTD